MSANVVCGGSPVGDTGGCERVAFGHLKAGLQTGYCADTGGGWSDGLVAHATQLHPVPDGLSDESAVMVEPAACAVHAALAAGVTEGSNVVVLGAGTLGLCTIAALRQLTLELGPIRFGIDRASAGDQVDRVIGLDAPFG